MKRFNVSILAVVAILAIGLTAFTKAEPAGKRVAVPNCYRLVETEFTSSDCIVSEVILNSTQATSTCTLAGNQVGKKIQDRQNFIASIECNQVANFFCCAQLIRDENPCPGQQVLTFVDYLGATQTLQPAKIHAVFCKSAL